ncbi:hypothetical protein K501DRAFT_272811 [Backusella circina FSU 941]|nr:hypothetical protein K501DRAFT_272811 [Backusella circina FSU 941]
MPLLNGKKIPLSAPIPYDPKRRRKEVFYLKLTNELFPCYEAYISRYNLYYQPLWECEVTGKKKLTYAQALESEKVEKDRAEYLFCKALRKHILLKIQFKTIRLDELVREIYHCDYIPDEIIQLTINGFRQNARILEIIPSPESTESKQYKIKLLHHLENDDGIRKITEGQIRRNKKIFNRNNIQRFITECARKEKDTPWIIHDALAIKYGIENNVPHDLQDDVFLSLKARKRKLKAAEKDAEKRIKREHNQIQKQQLKLEKERLREERKRQAGIKYPMEDLDLPIYRKDPNQNWSLIDMCPKTYVNDNITIPYPNGGRSARPTAHQDSPIPPELYDLFLSTWSFLTIFSEPLKLATYSLDDFERALFHNAQQPKATVLVEYNASLLNVIINERKVDTASELANGDVMEDYLEEEMKLDEEKKHHRVWRDKEQLKISQKWDTKELKANYDRRGWENTLIGCLNDVATPDLIPDLDQSFNQIETVDKRITRAKAAKNIPDYW